jgi:hypothetical protein
METRLYPSSLAHRRFSATGHSHWGPASTPRCLMPALKGPSPSSYNISPIGGLLDGVGYILRWPTVGFLPLDIPIGVQLQYPDIEIRLRQRSWSIQLQYILHLRSAGWRRLFQRLLHCRRFSATGYPHLGPVSTPRCHPGFRTKSTQLQYIPHRRSAGWRTLHRRQTGHRPAPRQ